MISRRGCNIASDSHIQERVLHCHLSSWLLWHDIDPYPDVSFAEGFATRFHEKHSSDSPHLRSSLMQHDAGACSRLVPDHLQRYSDAGICQHWSTLLVNRLKQRAHPSAKHEKTTWKPLGHLLDYTLKQWPPAFAQSRRSIPGSGHGRKHWS